VVSHTTFSELRWQRDPFARKFFVLPPGFQGVKHLLSDEFVEILEDISALQCIRDSTYFIKEDAMSMAHIDSHQASVQSRLLSLSSHSAVLECCYLAAYLCSTMLRCKIWRTSIIPVSQLLDIPSLHESMESNLSVPFVITIAPCTERRTR